MRSMDTVITICGSMRFYNDMLILKSELEKHHCTVHIPIDLPSWIKIPKVILRKIYYSKIRQSDKVLIFNKDDYIGEDTFLEIRYADSLNIPIQYEYHDKGEDAVKDLHKYILKD